MEKADEGLPNEDASNAPNDDQARDRSRSPRIPGSQLSQSPFSENKYRQQVFAKLGRSSSTGFYDRVNRSALAQDVQASDDGITFMTQVNTVHECVSQFISAVVSQCDLKHRYDEMCVIKTIIDQHKRGGGASHDLFQIRLFVTLFSGPVCPWRAHPEQTYRYSNGEWIEASSLTIQQALRIEGALSKAESTLRRMSKDKDFKCPTWQPQWFIQDESQAGTDKSNEEPDEGFTVCCKILRESLVKLLQNGGQFVLKNFMKWCKEPKKPKPMIAFHDKCVKLTFGQPSEFVDKSPSLDCYMGSPYSISYKVAEDDIEKYDLLMATLYGEDTDALEIEGGGEAISITYQRHHFPLQGGNTAGFIQLLLYVCIIYGRTYIHFMHWTVEYRGVR